MPPLVYYTNPVTVKQYMIHVKLRIIVIYCFSGFEMGGITIQNYSLIQSPDIQLKC